MKRKPCCETVLPWLKANLGAHCLSPLTGTDAHALCAAVHIVELYSYDPCERVAVAYGLIVGRMQPSMQELAYHAVAHVMDWCHRKELWELAGLPSIEPRECAHEPDARTPALL